MPYSVEEARRNGWGSRAEEFARYMDSVDQHIARISQVGFSHEDLPDHDFASAFNAGVSPEECAYGVLEGADFPFDLDEL